MKKLFIYALFIMFNIIFTTNSYSQVTEIKYGKKFEILMTSYPDYEPLSYTVFIGRYKTLNNVFEQTLQEILGENVEVKAETGNTFSDNQEYLKEGTFDMFMGLYNETHTQIKNFDHMEYLFPAIGNNPIHLITLPEKASQIKSLEDLKSLKGVYIAKEYFSDYVEQSLKNYNVEASLDIFDTYRKLFLGEIDYIIGGYYYHYTNAIRLGLKDYVSFSKKPIWTIPMFATISKKSKHYSALKSLLLKKVKDKTIEEKIKNNIKEFIEKEEKNNIGVVPPKFVLKEGLNALTPADLGALTPTDKATNKD